MSSICRTKSLDHLVLTVSDLDATIKFYEEVMGMQVETFASAGSPNVKRYALKFGCQKINLHVHGNEFEPKAQSVQPGSADLCFLIDDDVDDVLEALKGRQIEVLEGGQVVERTGAQGKIRSVYCRDPDGNLVEQTVQSLLNWPFAVDLFQLPFNSTLGCGMLDKAVFGPLAHVLAVGLVPEYGICPATARLKLDRSPSNVYDRKRQ